MQPFAGFTGPSYSTVPAVALESTRNYFCAAAEVPGATKTEITLFQRPGTIPFTASPAPIAGRARGLIQFDGNGVVDGAAFGVNGTNFFQLAPDGSTTKWGDVVDDGLPVQIVANEATKSQVAVCSGNKLYVLSNGVFAEVPNDGVNFFGARAIAFIDGYLLALCDLPNKQQFQISALHNMTIWSGVADTGQLLGQTDPIINLEVSQEYVHFIGSRRGEIWYNTGNAGFPFAIEPGAFIETGMGAKASLVKASDGSLLWIGQDARGGKIALRSAGLQTARVSDHTVEAAWQRYTTTDDCWAYTMQWIGHEVARFIFPTAQAGWQYDLTESARLGYPVWTELYFTDANGNQLAPLERSYCYAFGKHLIGSGGADSTPGVVYAMDAGTFADCAGSPFGLSSPTGASATLELGIDAAAALLLASVVAPAPTPFYFTIDGQELCRCTGIFAGADWIVERGLGSVAAGAWDAGAALDLVTLPGFPLTRDRIVRLPWAGGLRQFLDKLEFALQVGVGTDTGQGANPQLLVRISRDGGNTWGNEKQVPLGRGGQYMTRVVMNLLGSYRDGAIWIRITDPVFCAIVGAQHYIRTGGS